MPERQSRIGDEGLRRLVYLLEGLGWTLRGDPEIDIPCTLKAHDRDADHGVDAYMTYDGPFRGKERGIFIESKSKQWQSINPSSIEGDMEQLLSTLECAPEADEFETFLNFDKPRIVNAGILGMYANDEYEHETFDDYINQVSLVHKRRKAFQILVLGNRQLDRLASLHSEFTRLKDQYNGDTDSLAYYYPSFPDSVSERSQLVTLEYMLSDYVYAKLETTENVGDRGVIPKDINIVFSFDEEIDSNSLEFMYQSLVKYQLLDADEVWVYLGGPTFDEDVDIQVESIEQEFRRNVIPEDSPNFELKALPRADYPSYTDRLMEG